MGESVRVLIGGYYGFGNLGDELLLSVVINRIQQKFPHSRITVLSQNPGATMTSHPVAGINRWNCGAILWHLVKSDIFVLGGGGLFQDSTSIYSLPYYLGLVFISSILRKKTVLLCMGVESIKTPLLRKMTQFVLSLPRVSLSVRDRESAMVIKALGIDEKKIAVTADPVFLFPFKAHPWKREENQARVLLIPRFPQPRTAVRAWLSIADFLKRKNISFCSTLFQPESEVGQWEKTEMPRFETLNFCLKRSPDEQAAWVGDFEYVVSGRLHGLILAALAGRPFMGLGSVEKVGRFCREWNMPFTDWEQSDMSWEEPLSELLRMGPQNNQQRILELSGTAAGAFEQLF